LSLYPEGNLSDDQNPSIEHIATIERNGATSTIDLERVELQPGSPVWLFTPATIAAIPRLVPTSTESAIEARLPRFLVSITFLETPLWKWIALVGTAFFVVLIFRFLGHVLLLSLRKLGTRFKHPNRWAWLRAVLEPVLVFVSVLVFGTIEQIINPAALSRLYISRFLLLIVVCTFAWCLINVIELFLNRIDSLLDPRQRMVSHSLIYLGRRVTRVVLVIVAGIVVLSNWGYDMTTIIAGLGVGGIAFALAAQKTIENVFGGVSVIGDNPVMVGDFGKFGNLVGTVEDIGMRSARIRTLDRAVVSVPNAAFATMNLENYSLRDKILFNPTFQLKRPIAKEKVYECMAGLAQMLSQNSMLEVGPTPVRLTGLTASSYAIEIFAYARTSDIHEYYKLEPGLFMAVDEVLTDAGVELA
jgi:MscS family membrane protein